LYHGTGYGYPAVDQYKSTQCYCEVLTKPSPGTSLDCDRMPYHVLSLCRIDASCRKYWYTHSSCHSKYRYLSLELFSPSQMKVMWSAMRITYQNKKASIQTSHKRARECHQIFKTSNYEEHKNRNPDRVIGTCQWVINDLRYRSWLVSKTDNLLLVTADPGCGKSVLSKSLIGEELKSHESRSTCYFFFKDNDEQNSLNDALCSLLHQLFSYRPHLLSHAIPSFNRNGPELQRETAELWQILLQAATDSNAGDVVCILDALDECAIEGQANLSDLLTTFYNSSRLKTSRLSTLKFLVTSRPYRSIERRFHKISAGLPTIRLAG
jgi:hypothetical protein